VPVDPIPLLTLSVRGSICENPFTANKTNPANRKNENVDFLKIITSGYYHYVQTDKNKTQMYVKNY
jgi:hypothetical protein